MVVVIADGRKLWFSAAEVQAARRQLREQDRQEVPFPQVIRSSVPLRLVHPAESPAAPDSSDEKRPIKSRKKSA
jgi:hypothetical protein